MSICLAVVCRVWYQPVDERIRRAVARAHGGVGTVVRDDVRRALAQVPQPLSEAGNLYGGLAAR